MGGVRGGGDILTMRNKVMDKKWLILVLFVLIAVFSLGCGREIPVGPNRPPVIESFIVSILSPQDGNRYDPATIIGFAREAEDFEQGLLSGAFLVLVLFNNKEGV